MNSISKMFRGIRWSSALRWVGLFALMAMVLGPMDASAQLTNFVTLSGLDITYSPGVLVTPVLTAAVAAVAAGVTLVLLGLGLRWVYRMVKGSK